MEARLGAESREVRGKNHARRVRRGGRVPAVVYGGDAQGGQPVSVDPKELMRILHSESGVNTLIELALDGGKADRVLVKEFQLDPISSELLHVDFYRLAMDRVLTVTVPVSLTGEAVGVKLQGGLVDFVNREVQVECMPSEIPEHIEVDVTELRVGDGVRLRDRLEGVTWKPVSDPDTLLVHVLAPKVDEAEDEAAAEGVEGETDESAAEEGGED